MPMRLVRATHFSAVPQRVTRTSRAMTAKREYPSPVLRYPDAHAVKPSHDGRGGDPMQPVGKTR